MRYIVDVNQAKVVMNTVLCVARRSDWCSRRLLERVKLTKARAVETSRVRGGPGLVGLRHHIFASVSLP